jgi:hypothetical protein
MIVAHPMVTWFETRGVAALLTMRVQDLILFYEGEAERIGAASARPSRHATILLPVGQIISFFRLPFSICPAPFEKIFLFYRNQITLIFALSRPTKRGGSRSSRNAGRDAVDAEDASDEGI